MVFKYLTEEKRALHYNLGMLGVEIDVFSENNSVVINALIPESNFKKKITQLLTMKSGGPGRQIS